jgi:hypothetical protein
MLFKQLKSPLFPLACLRTQTAGISLTCFTCNTESLERIQSSGMLRHVAPVRMSILTQRNITEDGILHSHCHENLTSHMSH